MDKIGQLGEFEGMLKLVLLAVIVLPLFGVIIAEISSMFTPQTPTCDYAPYQTNLSSCSALVTNLSNQLNQTPVKYIQNITYVPVEKPIYRDTPTSITILILSFAFSILVTIKLFNVKIKLPQELEDELKKIEKWIKAFKWMSLVLSILIFLRLGWILFSLF